MPQNVASDQGLQCLLTECPIKIWIKIKNTTQQPLKHKRTVPIDNTVKPVLSGHFKIDKTKVLMKNGSLMDVERIAECSRAFCKTFDLH